MLFDTIFMFDDAAWSEMHISNTGLILGVHPTNERRRYKVTPSLIVWVQT